MPGQPTCLAIILCEAVVEDVRSHNKCILNTYNTIYSPRFPARHDRLTVFVALTDGHGAMPLELRLVRYLDNREEKVLSIEGTVQFTDPLAVADLTFDLRGVTIPAEGQYAVQVWVNRQLLGVRRLQAQLVQMKEQKP